MLLSKLPLRYALLPGLLGLSIVATAQVANSKVITTAVPVLTLSPDSRGAALGEAGVATSPDANSAYYNAGKLGFVPNQYSVSPSYTPWLRSITDDMGLAYLSGYAKLNQRAAISASLLYFDLGSIALRSAANQPEGEFNPKEYAFALSYGQKLSEYLGVGVTARYIRSNLVGPTSGGDSKPGNALAVDLGTYYTRDLSIGGGAYNLALGASVANIGNKMTYTDANQADFLPMNIKVGTAFTRELDPYNKLTLTLDGTKLLVPSPYYEDNVATDNASQQAYLVRRDAENEERRRTGVVSGIINSFSDAPGGFSEELQEINLSAGLEYTYKDLLMARVGYFYENPDKGDRRYLSLGLGGRFQVFGIDGAYLVPSSEANPLAQTIRVSLHFNFNKLEEAFGNDASPTN